MLPDRTRFTIVAVLLAAGLLTTASTRAQVPVQDRQPAGSALRPAVAGPSGGVSTGHPLTTAAAFGTLLKGGNAFDAGVTALLVGGVVEQDLYSLGGEALVLVYPQKDKTVTSIVGQGWAPKAVNVDWYLSRGKTLQGEGLDPAVTPGALHAALTVLEKWGTMSFEQVAAPAIEYAEKGFPMRTSTQRAIENQKKLFDKWPDNQKYWYKADGSYFKPGDTIKLPTLARTLTRMVEAERAAKAKGRAAGIVAARDRFYKGDIAKEMVAFLQKHQAPFDLTDFSEFYARIEPPAQITYRGYTVYKHGFGSQGPMLLQTLNILEQFDLQKMGYGSADYLHTVTEAMKLAYADRDTYYADPAFVQVPAEGLLSKAYAKERAAQIDPAHASKAFVAGDPLKYDSKVKQWTYWKADVKDGTVPTAARGDDRRGGPAGLARARLRGRQQGHHAHRHRRQGRQRVRLHAERRLGERRGDPGRHRHRHERARRAVLPRYHARQPDPSARPPALHPDAVAGVQGRRAADGARHSWWRQPGPDDPAGVPQHGGVLGRVVSEPARRARAPARADAAFPRLVLAARRRVQQAERGGGDSR